VYTLHVHRLLLNILPYLKLYSHKCIMIFLHIFIVLAILFSHHGTLLHQINMLQADWSELELCEHGLESCSHVIDVLLAMLYIGITQKNIAHSQLFIIFIIIIIQIPKYHRFIDPSLLVTHIRIHGFILLIRCTYSHTFNCHTLISVYNVYFRFINLYK